MLNKQKSSKDKKGIGLTEREASTCEVKQVKFTSSTINVISDGVVLVDPFERDSTSVTQGIRPLVTAKTKFDPNTSLRMNFVLVTKKRSHHATVNNVSQPSTLKHGQGLFRAFYAPLLTKETESKPIIWDIGDEEEEYSFVNEYSSFKKEPIMFVEDESCPVYDTDNEEEESMPVYDTDIEDVIEEEEGFVGKGGFSGEEDNIEDVVVVANDLCSSMIQRYHFIKEQA
ncbi:hypothetical protein Tco_0093243 [Tanacetum coccineum]